MVYSAFLPIRLLNDYPYPLECLTCYENFLLVGTKQGLLLVYELTPKLTAHPEFFIPNLSCLSPQLKEIPFQNETSSPSSSSSPPSSPSGNLPSFFTHVKTTRTLGKKPITQLAAISEFGILLALAEGRMSVYQLPNCQLITSVRNSKGASLFAYCMEYSKTSPGQVDSTRLEDVSQSLSLDSSSNISISSETKASQSSETNTLELRICVVVKRHLYFWRWEPKSREFILPGGANDSITPLWPSELTLPEVIRSITFCGLSKLIAGHRGEYLLINIINGEIQFISTPGKNQLPIVTSLPHCLHMSSTHLDETPHTINNHHKSWLSHKNNNNNNNNNAHNYYFNNTTLRGNSSSFIIHPDASLETSGIVNKSDTNNNDNNNNNCVNNNHKYSYYQPLLPGAQTFLGIEQDDALVVISPYHELKSVYQMKWSSAPYQIHVYPPYIIGTMHDMLEIRVLYPNQKMIQQLSIPRVTAMCHSGGWFYASTAPASVNTSLSPASSAAVTTNNTDYSSSRQSNKESSVGRNKPHSTGSSGNEIWLILSANRLKFIQDLVKQKEYELAICLARTGLYAGQNAVETLQITTLYAIHLYHEMKFPEALNLFTDLLINPKHVLTLFPGILSEQQLKQQHEGQITDYPCEISIMNSSQMTDAFEPLITYLLTWRRLLKQQLTKTSLKQSKLLNNIREAGGEGEDSSQLSLCSRSGQQQHHAKEYNNNNIIEFLCYSMKDVTKLILPCIELLELIDTSLLKCYLSTNTARVAPLLRQENVCILEESVKSLLEHKRYQELVMLYQSRGLHREALSILQQFSAACMKHHRGGVGGGLMVTTTTTTNDASSQPQNMITFDDKLHKSGLIKQLGHPKRIIHYFLQYLNASHIDLLIDYTKWHMLHYPTSWMRILSNWQAKLTVKYQSQFSGSNTASPPIDAVKRDEFIAFCSNYRNQILQYMEQYAPHLIIPYLELIIFVHWNNRHIGDDDEDDDDDEEAEEEEVGDEDDDVEDDVVEDENIGNNDSGGGVLDSSRDDDSHERLESSEQGGDNSCIMNSNDDSIENKINNGDAAGNDDDVEKLLLQQKSKPISIVQQSEHVPVGKHSGSKKNIIEHTSNKSSPASNIVLGCCRVASLSQLSCNSMDSTQSGYMSPGKRSSAFKEIISSSLWPLPCVKRSKQRRLTTSTMNSLSKVDNNSTVVNTNDLDALPSIPNYPAYMDVCDIHTRYAIALIRRAQSLQPANKSFAFKVNEEQPKLGSVARLRLRLLRFLMHPGTQYSSARLLDKCPYDAFFEERALLLANLNRHEQALSLWVHLLDDWSRAINHCINVYQRSELSSTICKNNNHNNNSNNNDNDTKRDGGSGVAVVGGVGVGDPVNTDYPNNSHYSLHGGAINSGDKHSNSSSSLNRHNSLNSLDNSSLLDLNNNNTTTTTNHETLNNCSHNTDYPLCDYCNNSNIFFLLIQICLQPTEPTSLGIVLPSSVKFTPKLNKALEILHQFSTFIDPVKVIRIMPTVTLNSVGDYLKSMFISQESTLTQLVFLQNASKAELIASCTDRIKSTREHLSILPSTRCHTCRRRIGNSAFVKQPGNTNHHGELLEHYGCCKDLTFKNT